MATCSIPSADDTMAGLRAAKDAYSRSAEVGDRAGMEGAMNLFARVLMFNGVPASVLETLADPEEVFADVMTGKYSTPSNALPQKAVQKQLKLEELIPSSKQLERGKFGWTKPLEGFCYTLLWQSSKERDIKNKKARGSYDIMALNTGAKTTSLTQAFSAMSNDAAERNTSMVIYMTSHDCSQQYATNIMS
eukprot:CAMPEP_0168447746 /NCGR_PEP_ID=MMETSP0228-20121227/46743_1 /TAXON_ID=133427 /ORGANISM="Protoceratium reticulatum, Strain CCCM 535 (=CCMP 1889)" /LENGTH=190 /DNA_ID=CAMNT_0008462269 /DNA_START=1 /DNA_END=569 /DNA_ORIENTATION=-